MRSRVMPGSSPTMERRLWVRRLKRVDLPTLGRPTMATSGRASTPGVAGTTDLRYVGKGISKVTGNFDPSCDAPRNVGQVEESRNHRVCRCRISAIFPPVWFETD